jgi:hypothetical protein
VRNDRIVKALHRIPFKTSGTRGFLMPRFSACTAHVIAAAMVGSAMHWRASGRNEPADRVIRQIVDILSDGVAKPPA